MKFHSTIEEEGHPIIRDNMMSLGNVTLSKRSQALIYRKCSHLSKKSTKLELVKVESRLWIPELRDIGQLLAEGSKRLNEMF